MDEQKLTDAKNIWSHIETLRDSKALIIAMQEAYSIEVRTEHFGQIKRIVFNSEIKKKILDIALEEISNTLDRKEKEFAEL